MTPAQKLEKLEKLLQVTNEDYATTKEVAQIFADLITRYKELDSETSEKISTIKDIVQNELSSISSSSAKKIDEVHKSFKAQIIELQKAIKESEAKQVQPLSKEDVVNLIPKVPTITEIVEQVKPLIPVLPSIDEVRNQFELLQGDERLDKSAIKGLDTVIDQTGLDRAIGILDKRTQFLINKTTSAGGGAVSSVFSRTGAVVATAGDYNTSLVTENTNLYFTNARAVTALTGQSNTIFTNGAGYITSAGAPVQSVSTANGSLTISPTTGAVVASLNLGNANTWTALQSFSLGITSPGTRPSVDSTTAYRIFKANGTTPLLNVNSVDGIYTFNTISSSNRTGYFYVNNSNSNSLFGVFEGYDPLKYVGWNAAPGSTIGIGADYPTDGTNAAARIDIWGTSGVFVHGSLYPSSDVTIARISDATSTATQQWSNPLNLQASLWNGTTAVTRLAIIQNRASTALQGISFLTFSIQDVNAGQIEVMTLRNDNGNLGFNQSNPQFPVSFGSTVIQKKVAIYDNGLGTSFYGFGLTAGAVIVTANDTAVAWFSNNAGGSLGIHNAAPGAFLDIGGSVATGTVSVEDDFYVTRSTQGGVSYPQMFGLAVGRYKVPSAFEPFSRVDFKLKAAVNSTLTPDVTVMTMCDNGNIGAGTVLPTATMHLRAGTATAGTAPLKIDPGVVLTSPEAGTLEFINAETGLTFTAVSTRRQVLLDTATQTITSKRVTKRVVTTTQSATPAINTDVTDVSSITALAQAITSFTMTGTPVDGDSLIIRITDNGTARAITWGTSFEASTTALPTTTVVSTMLTVGFIWNTATSKWRCIASA